MEEFVIRAFLGGAGIAIIAAPVGCLVVWRQLSYFGATVAHAALLGIALALVTGYSPALGIVLVSLFVAVALYLFERYPSLSSDTVLGIMAHALLALGLVIISTLQGMRIDLMGYLFGDVLSISRADLAWIAASAVLVLLVLRWLWNDLLLITLNPELARADGVRVRLVELVFLVLLALAVAISIQVIGILLTVSMLIIPAATARQFAATPEAMAGLAVVMGIAAVAAGVFGSVAWNFPSGAAIVVSAFILFLASLVVPLWRRGTPEPGRQGTSD